MTKSYKDKLLDNLWRIRYCGQLSPLPVAYSCRYCHTCYLRKRSAFDKETTKESYRIMQSLRLIEYKGKDYLACARCLYFNQKQSGPNKAVRVIPS